MSLTPRQLAVADAICEGLCHKEVTDKLKLKRHNMEKRLMRVYSKTETHNAAQLFWWMLRNKAGKTYEKAKLLV